MLQHVGALADQRGAVAANALDNGLDRLLAEFLRDLGLAARQQLRGVGGSRIGGAPRFDDLPKAVQGVAKHVGHGCAASIQVLAPLPRCERGWTRANARGRVKVLYGCWSGRGTP